MLPLRVESLYFRYGRQAVLRGVDLELGSGELFALVGANGAGKTTLFSLVAGLLAPDRGSITFGSARSEATLRAGIAVVTHQPQAYLRLSAHENLALAESLAKAQGLSCIPAEQALARMGIAHAAHRQVATFSRGMVQRVALARAWARRPMLYLLDEPFTALDRRGKFLLREVLREEIARGAAVIFASHDFAMIAETADAALYLKDGRIDSRIDLSVDRQAGFAALLEWGESPGEFCAAAGLGPSAMESSSSSGAGAKEGEA